MKTRPFLSRFLASIALGLALVTAAPAFAQGADFIKVESQHSFASTVHHLKEAVSANQMMVMGHVNQGKVLSMTGLHLAGAESFLVGSPHMGKMAFGMNPAAGAVLPARIYVWSDHGKAYVGYFKPSSLMTQISPAFGKMAGMLDQKFAMITQGATR